MAAIGDQTVVEGSSLTLALLADDPDGDSLAFSADALPAFAQLIDNGNGTAGLVLTPADSDAGSYDAAVTVADSGEPPLSHTLAFTIQVERIDLEMSPGTIDFGDVIVGETAFQSFAVANTGTVAV